MNHLPEYPGVGKMAVPIIGGKYAKKFQAIIEEIAELAKTGE